MSQCLDVEDKTRQAYECDAQPNPEPLQAQGLLIAVETLPTPQQHNEQESMWRQAQDHATANALQKMQRVIVFPQATPPDANSDDSEGEYEGFTHAKSSRMTTNDDSSSRLSHRIINSLIDYYDIANVADPDPPEFDMRSIIWKVIVMTKAICWMMRSH